MLLADLTPCIDRQEGHSEILRFQGNEEQGLSLFSEITSLVGRSNATILDIGANNGDHTLLFLSLFRHARVFSFEPDPRAKAKYRAKVHDPRAQLVEKALGATTGSQTFYQSTGQPPHLQERDWSEGWDLSGSIKKPLKHLEVHPWVKFETTLTIDVTTLDAWAKDEQVNGIDFIWADVQGAEGDLIDGGMETLRRTRFFYTEYSNDELYEGELNLDQIVAKLPFFEVVKVYEHDVLLKNRYYTG